MPINVMMKNYFSGMTDMYGVLKIYDEYTQIVPIFCKLLNQFGYTIIHSPDCIDNSICITVFDSIGNKICNQNISGELYYYTTGE